MSAASPQEAPAGIALPHFAPPHGGNGGDGGDALPTYGSHLSPSPLLSRRSSLFFSLPTAADSATRNGFLTAQAQWQRLSEAETDSAAGPPRTYSVSAYVITEEEYRHEGVLPQHSGESNRSGADAGADSGDDGQGCRNGAAGSRGRLPHGGGREHPDSSDAYPSYFALDSAEGFYDDDGLVASANHNSLEVPLVPQLFPPSSPPVDRSGGGGGGGGGNHGSSSNGSGGGHVSAPYNGGGGWCSINVHGMNSNSGSCNPSPRADTSTATPLSRCHLSRKDDTFHSLPRGNTHAVGYGGGGYGGGAYEARFTPLANGPGSSPPSFCRHGSYYGTEANSFCQEANSSSSVYFLANRPNGGVDPNRSNSVGEAPAAWGGGAGLGPMGTGPMGTGPCLSTESLGDGGGPLRCDSYHSLVLEGAGPRQQSPQAAGDRDGAPTATATTVAGAKDAATHHPEERPRSVSEEEEKEEQRPPEAAAVRRSVGPPSRRPEVAVYTRSLFLATRAAAASGGDTAVGTAKHADPASVCARSPHHDGQDKDREGEAGGRASPASRR